MDPVSLPDSNPKSVYGVRKAPLHLNPAGSLVDMAWVFNLGAEKYGAYNWRQNSVSATVYVAALLRHIHAWYDGETIDPESGMSHVAHAMACAAIILDAQHTGNLIDDRPLPGEAGPRIRETERSA